jgi:hypothetical protein
MGARLASLVEPTGASVTTFGSIMRDSDTAWPEDPGAAMRIFLDDSITALPRLLELEPPAAAPRRASC